jgi:hypothetical protein
MFVIAALSAPLLTTTDRWPALVVLAAGILAAYNPLVARNSLSVGAIGDNQFEISQRVNSSSERIADRVTSAIKTRSALPK